jgi:flagellar assembly factor FliW
VDSRKPSVINYQAPLLANQNVPTTAKMVRAT